MISLLILDEITINSLSIFVIDSKCLDFSNIGCSRFFASKGKRLIPSAMAIKSLAPAC